VDFESVDAELTFTEDCDMLECINVTIVDDKFFERKEYFQIHVETGLENAVIVGSQYVSVTIYDDEGA
jgi:hypothetical protein